MTTLNKPKTYDDGKTMDFEGYEAQRNWIKKMIKEGEVTMTSSQAKHTPLPWFSGTAKNEYTDWCEIKDSQGNHICSVEGLKIKEGEWNLREVDKANAAYIVKCVNSHEALLEACKKTSEFLNENTVFKGNNLGLKNHLELVELLKQAIALAEKDS